MTRQDRAAEVGVRRPLERQVAGRNLGEDVVVFDR